MNKEHTISNAARRMKECAEHIREVFSGQGYTVDIVKSKDSDCDGLFVQVSNIAKSSAGSLLKITTGMNVAVVLVTWKIAGDLKFKVYDSKWMSPHLLATTSIFAPGPQFPFLDPLWLIGCMRQRRLLKKVFMETMSFLTTVPE